MTSARQKPLKSLIVLFVTSLFFFYEFGLNNIFNSLEIYIAHDYQLSSVSVGFISSLYFYANIIFLIPAGLILDRLSPRKVITFALLACSLSVLCVALSNNLILLVVSRFVMGIGGGFCFIGCVRIAANWFDTKHMARVTGFIVTMGMLGGFMVQLPMTYMINQIGWRHALAIVAIIGLVITMLIWLVVRDYPAYKIETFKQRQNDLSQMGLLTSLKQALGRVQNWLCGLYTSLMNLPIYLLGALWGIPYLITVHHMSNTHAATVAGMLFIGTMIGSPLAGWISDSLRKRKLLMIMGAVLSIILIYIVIHLQSHSFALMLSLFLLLGLVTSTQVISYPIVVENNSRALTSTAVSIISLMALGGGAIIQPLFGKLLALDWHGKMQDGTPVYSAHAYSVAMYILALTFVAGLIVALLIKETHCQPPESQSEFGDVDLEPTTHAL